jgi:triphosphatase
LVTNHIQDVAVSVETELKLRVAPEHLAKLKRCPLLKSISAKRATTRKVYSVYYDTPTRDLNRLKMALRLRRVGRKWFQTLKGGGAMQAGLHSRNEWETEVKSNALDFVALKAAGGKLPAGLKNKLRPVFVTEFTRTMRLITFEGAQIEACFDSGEVKAGKKNHVISELELELKSGTPLQLFRLALALLDDVPLQIEPVNKAEYGYSLLEPKTLAVAKAKLPELDRAMNTPVALEQLVWSCVQHLQANVPGAVAKLNAEYLHQVRVALRRLKVILALILEFCPNKELAALRVEVGELCTKLGRAREWDVFIAYLPDMKGITLSKGVLQSSKRQRRACQEAVQQALQSDRFQRLLLRLGAWMNDNPLEKSRQPLPRFASAILKRRGDEACRMGRKLERKNDPARMHKLRIACKKLRYSAESFAPLYDRKLTGNYLAALVKLQDVLGTMNDITIAHHLLDELERDNLTEIRELFARDYLKLRPKFERAWKAFKFQTEFWRKS